MRTIIFLIKYYIFSPYSYFFFLVEKFYYKYIDPFYYSFIDKYCDLFFDGYYTALFWRYGDNKEDKKHYYLMRSIDKYIKY